MGVSESISDRVILVARKVSLFYDSHHPTRWTPASNRVKLTFAQQALRREMETMRLTILKDLQAFQ